MLNRYSAILKLAFLLITLTYSTLGNAQTRLLILGDSLSAGYGLLQHQAWVNLLQNTWQQQGKDVHLINGSISGETTSGGLSRLPRLLELHNPDILLIELGGNDGLRGYPAKKVRQNLSSMIKLAKEANTRVIVSKVMLPTNYGKRYGNMFSDSYEEVTKEFDIPLIPFFMEPIVADKSLMQKDGLHPNAKAQPQIAAFMDEKLSPLLIKD